MPTCWKCSGTGMVDGISCSQCSILLRGEEEDTYVSTGLVDEQTMFSHLSTVLAEVQEKCQHIKNKVNDIWDKVK